MNETLTGTTTPGQSGPASNGNKEITRHSPDFQNKSFIISYSLVSLTGHLFVG